MSKQPDIPELAAAMVADLEAVIKSQAGSTQGEWAVRELQSGHVIIECGDQFICEFGNNPTSRPNAHAIADAHNHAAGMAKALLADTEADFEVYETPEIDPLLWDAAGERIVRRDSTLAAKPEGFAATRAALQPTIPLNSDTMPAGMEPEVP